jgi:hypothetical protein
LNAATGVVAGTPNGLGDGHPADVQSHRLEHAIADRDGRPDSDDHNPTGRPADHRHDHPEQRRGGQGIFANADRDRRNGAENASISVSGTNL